MGRLLTIILLGSLLLQPCNAYIFTGGPTFDYTKLPTQMAKLQEQIAKTKALSSNVTEMTSHLKVSKGLFATQTAQYTTLGNATSAVYDRDKGKILNTFSNNVSGLLEPGNLSTNVRSSNISALQTQLAGASPTGSQKVARARTLRMFTNQATGASAAEETAKATPQERVTAMQNGNYEEQALILEEVVKGQEYKKNYRQTVEELANAEHKTVLDAAGAIKQMVEIKTAVNIQASTEKAMLDYQRLQLLNSRNSINEEKMQYNAIQQEAQTVAKDLQ